MEIDIVDLLKQQIEFFGIYNKINISLKIEGSQQKIVSALYDQLQRVFTNLIKNAIEAIGEENKGEINIEIIDLPNGFYQVKIEDSGAGIDKNQQQQLFQPNFTTKSGGTGLGLAISKSIIESFDGKIYYSPQQNGKTCFVVELPKNK
jgi:signal transduction histidine kinase